MEIATPGAFMNGKVVFNTGKNTLRSKILLCTQFFTQMASVSCKFVDLSDTWSSEMSPQNCRLAYTNHVTLPESLILWKIYIHVCQNMYTLQKLLGLILVKMWKGSWDEYENKSCSTEERKFFIKHI